MYVVPINDEAELVLLPVGAADEVALLVEGNRDRLAPWESWSPTFSAEGSRAFLQKCIDDFAAGRRIGTFLRVDGELAGWTALDIRGHIGEVGFWLDAAYEGCGFASEAVRALLAIGFGQRELERIELRTSVLNTRSRAVAQRLGFVHEATLRHAIVRPASNGDRMFEDEAIYALLADEWIAVERAEGAPQ